MGSRGTIIALELLVTTSGRVASVPFLVQRVRLASLAFAATA